MEITGKVIAVLPAQGGTSKNGNEWKKQEYVVETHEQYPKKICFQIFGADKIEQSNIKEGEDLKVSIDIDAHEYNGRWFNNISAWKVERAGEVDSSAFNAESPRTDSNAVPADAPIASKNEDESSSVDDLPF